LEQLKKIGLPKHCYIQTEDNVYIGPRNRNELENSMLYINHSCNPNAGIKGKKIVIAIKDIKREEEISIDYAMCYCNPLYLMRCNCRSKNCRKKITGNDWRNPELQRRYKGHFSFFIQAKINKSSGPQR